MFLMAGTAINWLLRRPLFVITIAWIAGIILSEHFHPIAFLVLAIISLLIWLFKQASSVFLLLFILFISSAYCSFKREIYDNVQITGGLYTGYTENSADIYRDFDKMRWRTEAVLTAKRNGNEWLPVTYHVIISGTDTPPEPGYEMNLTMKNMEMPESGNIYNFDDKTWQMSRGISGRMKVIALEYTGKPAGNATRSNIRVYLQTRLQQAMTGNYSALHTSLLSGIVLGAHGTPPPAILTDSFTRSGTIHILIVSGSQVALLAGIFLLPLLALPSGGLTFTYPRLRILLTICSLMVLAFYLIISDRGPSIDRAVLMVLLGTLSMVLSFSPLALKRSYRPDHITLLAAAALIQLLINPFLIYDPGFLLSYLAVAGMILMAPIFIRVTHFLPRVISFGLSATLGAIIAILPVLAWYFGNIPLVAPISNLLIIPIASLLLPLGLIAFMLSAINTTIAIPICYICAWLLDGLISINQFMANIPEASITFYTRSPLTIFIYLLSVIIFLIFLQKLAQKLQPLIPAVEQKPIRMW
ncbi:MAG: ComEC/Rec2 family competence protein [bacterium]